MVDNYDHSSLNSSGDIMDENKPRGQARVLGECLLDLTPFKNQLTEISNAGIKVTMKFMRV